MATVALCILTLFVSPAWMAAIAPSTSVLGLFAAAHTIVIWNERIKQINTMLKIQKNLSNDLHKYKMPLFIRREQDKEMGDFGPWKIIIPKLDKEPLQLLRAAAQKNSKLLNIYRDFLSSISTLNWKLEEED